MEIFTFEQGSPEWYAARMGIPTASRFATVLASGKDGGASATRKDYMYELASEIITNKHEEGYTNAHMERGTEMEDEAREHYSFMTNYVCERVGFVLDRAKRAGGSPDSFVGKDGIVEIKTMIPKLLIPLTRRDEFPPAYKAQCQGNLWLAKREWVDIAVYWPRMKLFIKRAHRDEAYIAKLAAEVDRFNAELHEIVEWYNRYGNDRAAAA